MLLFGLATGAYLTAALMWHTAMGEEGDFAYYKTASKEMTPGLLVEEDAAARDKLRALKMRIYSFILILKKLTNRECSLKRGLASTQCHP